MVKRETLGHRLAQLRREKAWREARDIDQTEIAKAIGIGAKKQSYVSRWENDVIPKDEIIVKLAAFYGVNPGWLRYGTGEQYTTGPIMKESESETDLTVAHQVPTAKRAGGTRRPRGR